MMPLSLILSALFLTVLATTSGRQPSSGNVCPSTPLRQARCLRWSASSSPVQAPLRPLPGAELEPSPWTSTECTDSKGRPGTPSYCVFTSQTFANGRGVSLLTTTDRAAALEKLPAFADAGSWAGANSEPEPPFEERVLPGRGRGLIANKTLHRGDRVFAYSPILVFDGDVFKDLEAVDWIAMETAAVAGLPPATRDLFWELHGEPARGPVSDRIDTNAFELEIDGISSFIVVPEIARLNHDCRPNAVYYFDAQSLTHYVHAITDIAPGTEITITYVDPRHPRQQRQDELYASWAFNCSCSACTQHPLLIEASDKRLADIDALTRHLEEGNSSSESTQIAQALVSLYHQERLYGHSPSAYRLAAVEFCAQGQRWTAVAYARLSIESGMLSYGFEDEDVHMMKLLAEEPEAQDCWPAGLA